MEVTLVVRTGDDAGRRIAVPAGPPLRVGRQAPSEVRVADDPMLSNLHFSVECGPGGCRLRDLGSRFGTLLNGQKVTDAVLQNGDEITAGRTSFAVALEGATPPAAAPPADPGGTVADGSAETATGPVIVPAPAEPTAGVANLLALLRGQAGNLYAILDAAREGSVVERLKAATDEYQSLYDGEQGAELDAFAPWLVKLSPQGELLAGLAEDGWGNSWGVYLTSDADLFTVRRHLRKFLRAKLPDGRAVYFRYYDPRVLRTYLPTCTPDELASFFGPIRRYVMESPDPAEALEFAAGHKDWRKVPLAAGE